MTGLEVAFALPRRGRVGAPIARRHGGRTVEALLVALILGVVIQDALRSYRSVTAKTYVLNAISLSTNEHLEAITALAATGVAPDRVLQRPDGASSATFGSPAWRDGELVFPATERLLRLLGGDANEAPRRDVTVGFRLARAPLSGATIWLCGGASAPPGFEAPEPRHTTIDARYLPHFCRSAP